MLKYLFACQYNDGSMFTQNKEDVSLIDTKKSAFFDVLLDQVERFWIYNLPTGRQDPDNIYLVDLRDGHFEVNRVPFFMHEITIDATKHLTNFRLIYKRRNWVDNKGGHRIMFMIGWQANYPDSKNEKRIMMIN